MTLSYQGSNLDWLIQNQMCYHYTIGQLSGCKDNYFFGLKSNKQAGLEHLITEVSAD